MLTTRLRIVGTSGVVLKKMIPAILAAGALASSAAAATTPAKAKPKLPSPTAGVVLINTNLALQGASAAGTGIVLTKSGEELTNNHVIAGATAITVTVPATGKKYTA